MLQIRWAAAMAPVFAALVLVHPAIPVLADGSVLAPAPLSIAQPGSEFHFRRDQRTHILVVSKSEGSSVTYTLDGKPRSGFFFNNVPPEYLRPVDRAAYDGIWPLTVGKHVRYHRYSPTNADSWQDDVTVIGTETLTIDSKPIDTYVVRWNSSADRNRWEGAMMVWYAPSLGWIAKFKYSDNSGEKYETELISYTLPANPVISAPP